MMKWNMGFVERKLLCLIINKYLIESFHMRTLFICLSIFSYSLSTAQQDFIITGRIEMISNSDSIILKSAWGTFTTKIKNDGSFFISGNGIKTPSDALILTDSSGANSIWLEAGKYNIECKEEKTTVSPRPIFRILKLYGPRDAEINHIFQE
jgi:hypothetical protein